MYDQKFANYSQIERLQLLKDNCDEMETGTCIRTLTELSLIHISEPTRRTERSRMPSYA